TVAVLALREHGLHRPDVERRVEARARQTGLAVPGPRRHEVRFLAEVRAGVDVVIAGRGDVLVGAPAHQFGHAGRDGRPAVDGERTALAEVVLDVHDDQCGTHRIPAFLDVGSSSVGTRDGGRQAALRGTS